VGESELFVRRDYCEECFAASPPAISFAHWRSILPPPPGGVRKVVNLASLLAHFHALVETPAAEEDDPASDIRSSPLGAVETGRGGSEGLPAGDSGSDASRPAEARARLSYLLALFLVRRRMLRWEGVEAGILRLRCRESDRPVELAVPEMTPAELDAAISEFESLFA